MDKWKETQKGVGSLAYVCEEERDGKAVLRKNSNS